ncbi:hypothetical protein ALP79_200049 [Pseudomonas savastanoi pv. fraxini]|nr:hypothetical protein ALP79_200049 [Pseudomonas savastanoi pv. fraxini]RMR73995.1 hypothetical protein ALP80_200114 [Pseudomonas savastanoi pv. fraxini]
MSLSSKRDDYCGKCSQILTTTSEGLTYSVRKIVTSVQFQRWRPYSCELQRQYCRWPADLGN